MEKSKNKNPARFQNRLSGSDFYAGYVCGIVLLVLAACKDHRQSDNSGRVIKLSDTSSISKFVQYDTSNAGRIIFDSAYRRRVSDSGKRFAEEAMIAYKGCKVVVKSSFIKDSVSSDEPNLFNPICTNQQILFYTDQQLVKTVNYPVKTISQKNWDGDKVKMLENVINYTGFIRDKTGFVVVVSGWGGCNTCSVFYGLFYPTGDIVSIQYGTEDENEKPAEDFYKKADSLGINSRELGQETWSSLEVYRYPDHN